MEETKRDKMKIGLGKKAIEFEKKLRRAKGELARTYLEEKLKEEFSGKSKEAGGILKKKWIQLSGDREIESGRVIYSEVVERQRQRSAEAGTI